eukprot:5886313-Prorocentrum_lima.AAC.1
MEVSFKGSDSEPAVCAKKFMFEIGAEAFFKLALCAVMAHEIPALARFRDKLDRYMNRACRPSFALGFGTPQCTR